MQKQKRELLCLNKFDRFLVVSYWRWLLVKQTWRRQSLPMRLVPLHAACMTLTLLAFFHLHPNILALPILFTASYYSALTLLPLTLIRHTHEVERANGS